MNIYRERKSAKSRFGRDYQSGKAERYAEQKRDLNTVEYTNMSSYERYCRDKRSGNSDRYSVETTSKSPYAASYDDGRYSRSDYNSARGDYADRRDTYASDNRRTEYSNERRDNGYYPDDRYYRRDDRAPQYYNDRGGNRRQDYEFYDYPRQHDDQYDRYQDRYENYDTNKRKSSRKRGGMTFKSKLMIVVYFAIIAVIATLILVNAIPNAKADTSYKAPEQVEFNLDVLNKSEKGDTVDKIDDLITSNNKENGGNWFDDFCDGMNG